MALRGIRESITLEEPRCCGPVVVVPPGRARRNRRLRYAIITAMASKVTTSALQLAALPMMIGAIGVAKFGLYASVNAAVTWIAVVTLTAGPAIVARVAMSHAHEDATLHRIAVNSLFWPAAVNVVLLTPICYLVLYFVPVDLLMGVAEEGLGLSFKMAIAVALAPALLQPILGVIEAAQTGLQEQYVVNLRNCVGNALTAIALFVIARRSATLPEVVVAMAGPSLLMRILNVYWFVKRQGQPYLSTRFFQWTVCRELAGDALLFTVAGNLAAYLLHQFPAIVLVRHCRESAAAFSAGLALLAISVGLATMVFTPLWPAMADSTTRGDAVWMREMFRRAVRYTIAYAVAIAVGITVFGDYASRVLAHGAIPNNAVFRATLGAYCALYLWEYMNYMLLLGARKTVFASALMVIRALFVAVLLVCVPRAIADRWVFGILSGSVLLFTAVPLYLQAKWQIRAASILGSGSVVKPSEASSPCL